MAKIDQEEFLKLSYDTHGDLYDYSETFYKNSRTKVDILCKIHGKFSQLPDCHYRRKQGCPLCGNTLKNKGKQHTYNSFLEKAQAVHNNIYKYVESTFQGMRSKIEIICAVHGVYNQTPEAHLTGRGCRNCCKTGFNTNIPGWLYILKCGNITKIGITNLKPDTRAKRVSFSFGEKFNVVFAINFKNGKIPDIVETEALRYLRANYKPPLEKFEGHSECFVDVDYESLLAFVTNSCSKNLTK